MIAILALLPAQAQVAFEQAQSLRLARFSELVRIRMDALVRDPSPQQAQTMLEHDLPLFAGSLEGLNPRLLHRLEAALHKTLELAKAGQVRSLSRLSLTVDRLLEQAQQTLIPAATRQNPAFRAALLTQLLGLEGGVTEAYDAAIQGEEGAYALARAGLERVKVLWNPLRQHWLALGETVTGIDEALASLGRLIPVHPPRRFSSSDDAEQAALDAAFALERAARTPLLLHDLNKALWLSQTEAARGCKAAQEGRWRLAAEWIGAARLYYGEHLETTLKTLAPETQIKLGARLGQLSQGFQTRQTLSCTGLSELFSEAGRAIR